MNKPLVSIIIPTFNRAHLIGETLDSVLAQTYTNWECIIVDDGSTDDTGQVVLKYVQQDKRFQFYKRPDERPKGGNAARNYGFEVSKGDYIQWFDDDDIMLENYVKNKVDSFKGNTSFVVSSGYYTDVNLVTRKEIRVQKLDFIYKDYMLWNSHIYTPSVLFKRDFLEEKKLFSVEILRGQETEFFSRLFFQINSNEYKIINNFDFLYRQHALNKTTENKKMNKDFIQSKIYIFSENLKRAIILKDVDLMNCFFLEILKMFFQLVRIKEFNVAKELLGIIEENKEIFRKRYYFKISVLLRFSLIVKKEIVLIRRLIRNKVEFK